MKHVTAMTEEFKFPIVSAVQNLINTVTATQVNPLGMYMAERYVITFSPKALQPYAIYKEALKWDPVNWVWKHGSYSEGAFRSFYSGAMRNLEFRVHGTNK